MIIFSLGMGLKKDLSDQKRSKIVRLGQKGYSLRKIANIVGCSQLSATGIYKQFFQTGNFNSKRKLCRSKQKLSVRDLRRISWYIIRNKNTTLTEITSIFGGFVCKNTVRTALYRMGIFAYHSIQKPLISKKPRICRLEWGKMQQQRERIFWKNIIWSDETRVSLYANDCRKIVWRRQSEILKPQYLTLSIQHIPSIYV